MDDQEINQETFYRWSGNQLLVDLIVQAYASHDEIVGVQGDRLKVRLTCSPEAGKANEHLVKLVADYFGTPANRVHLIRGHQSRMKQISITDPQKNLPK